ncbi:MAG TPA: helix-turn-helix transcriptional regulator [Solirubrobacterales bacterium]|jgi:molybdopterin-binding protein|nr:helix-turn-helix transcriptional regulator [Solirubrobacterales bacterium]
MADDLTLGEAARALDVSVDTVRRWARAGKIETTRDDANRRRVPAAEITRLKARPARHKTKDTFSARNRFPGVVRSVEVDGVMALVEIEAGPHLVTAAITRDSVEELGLAPGVPAVAMVKATSVMIDASPGDGSGKPRSAA